MTPYLLFFFAGLAGSMHCIGMCGGFACAIGGDARGRAASVLRHGLYNLGRLSSYCFIGALVGHAGVLLVGAAGEATAGSAAQRALAALSGSLMIYIGLQFLGLFKRSNGSGFGIEPLAQALRQLVRTPGMSAPLAFGVLNGLLPCPLVYAFAAQAAASGGALQGLSIMAAFGLGTFPAMLAMGGLGQWLRRGASLPPGTSPIQAGMLPPRAGPALRSDQRVLGVPIQWRADSAPTPWRAQGVPIPWRAHGVRVAGGFIVFLGLVTVARGVLPISAHMLGH